MPFSTAFRKRAGLSDLRFHDLRHEAISRFFELGLNIPEEEAKAEEEYAKAREKSEGLERLVERRAEEIGEVKDPTASSTSGSGGEDGSRGGETPASQSQ